VWRLILARVATLGELETIWSLDDVARANAMLDLKSHIEGEAMKRVAKKGS